MLSTTGNIFAQSDLNENQEEAGIISSLEGILKKHLKDLEVLIKEIKKESPKRLDPQDFMDIRIHPLFMSSILLYSEKKYLGLIKKQECVFYSLLEQGLLRFAEGKITKVIALLKNKKKEIETRILTREDFLQYTYQKKCFKNKEIATLFSDSNVINTLQSTDFPKPVSNKQCHQIIRDWRNNPYLPGICKTWQTITNKERGLPGLKKLSSFRRIYIKNLCINLNDPEKFCISYLTNDIWGKIISGERPKYLMRFKCKNILGIRQDRKLGNNDLEKCRDLLLKKPHLCINKGNQNYPSLIPMPDCNTISGNLGISRLFSDYHDCPGMVANEGIVNIHRILMHLNPKKMASTPTSCHYETNASFAKLNMDFKNEKAWPLKICFMNVVTGEENCKVYIPGHNPSDPLSESNVVSSIIEKTINTPSKVQCRPVSNKKYNPALLEYKHQCFIVYDPHKCTPFHCPKKIYYRQKEIKGLSYRGMATFNYFPTTFTNKKFSLKNIMTETFKLKEKSIPNLTELKFFLDNNPRHIVQGIGCAEDLLPKTFKRSSVNQCRPLPFIIDGHSTRNNNTYLSTRTAIDDLHSPRPVNWHNIFAAVSTYRELHPLKTWTLNGITKFTYKN